MMFLGIFTSGQKVHQSSLLPVSPSKGICYSKLCSKAALVKRDSQKGSKDSVQIPDKKILPYRGIGIVHFLKDVTERGSIPFVAYVFIHNLTVIPRNTT